MSRISSLLIQLDKFPSVKEKYENNTTWMERKFLESPYISDKTKLSKIPESERKVVNTILKMDENYDKYMRSQGKDQEEEYKWHELTSRMGGKKTKRNKRNRKKSLKRKKKEIK
jgi:hypothetical protein